MRRTVCIPALLGLLAALSTAATVGAQDDPRSPPENTVMVAVGDGRFDGQARRIVNETETLLLPQDGAWSVRLAGAGDGNDAGAGPKAAVVVRVGLRPGDAPTPTDGGEASIWVDPVGWLPKPVPPHLAEIVTALPLAATVERDLRSLRLLLSDSTAEGDWSGEVLVPLDPWLSGAEAMILAAAKAADVTVRPVLVRPATVHPGPVASSAGSGGEELHWLDVDHPQSGSSRAVYLPPGSSVDAADLVSVLDERGVPSFSGRGTDDVAVGVLASQAGDRDIRLARLAALAVLAEVRGLAPVEETVASAEGGATGRLALNLDAASRLGLNVPWRLRLSATVFEQDNNQAGQAHTLTLDEVRRKALEANLDLRSGALATAAGEQDVRNALAALRPNLNLSTDARVSDRDSAEASFGSQPESLVTAIGEASWVLFSEDARSALDVTRRTQAARQLELQQLELDIELEAAIALLAVARNRALEAIARQQLDLTLAELDLARSRRTVGAGGRADVARLDARSARDQQGLVTAYGFRRSAELRLNRLLDRPMDGAIVPAVDAAAPLPFAAAVARPAVLSTLERDLLQRTRERAPELAAASEIVRARERENLAARRVAFLPDLRAYGQWSQRLEEGGAGTDSPSLPGQPPVFPQPPDSSWRLGLVADLPLFTGGARRARRTRAALDLDAARVLFRQADQRVEERLRLALLGVETAYESAHQARRAARAAGLAFEVVREGYRRGSESLTTLLAAQLELFLARQQEADATFDALGRWLEMQRATGAFFNAEDELLLSSPSFRAPNFTEPQTPSEES